MISIIVPVHNGERFLGEALSSIVGQTTARSTSSSSTTGPATRAGRSRAPSAPSVTSSAAGGGGSPAARNHGIRECTSEFMAVLRCRRPVPSREARAPARSLRGPARARHQPLHGGVLLGARASRRSGALQEARPDDRATHSFGTLPGTPAGLRPRREGRRVARPERADRLVHQACRHRPSRGDSPRRSDAAAMHPGSWSHRDPGLDGYFDFYRRRIRERTGR